MTLSKMLTLLLLLCCILTTTVKAQQPDLVRFSNLTSCLAASTYDRLSCISCDVAVTVDSVRGVDCKPLVEQHQSLDGRSCRDLEDVIQSIYSLDTIHQVLGCIEVNVLPKPSNEAHVILVDSPTRGMLLNQSIVLRGGQDLGVSAEYSDQV